MAQDNDFRSIPDWPEYDISSCGVLRNVSSGVARVLRNRTTKKGYLKGELHRNGSTCCIGIHRLVLMAFVGPCPKGMECRHLNGIPSDNRLENLAWGTRSRNALDRIKHGNMAFGELHRNAKLTVFVVCEARRLAAEGVCLSEISRRLSKHCNTLKYAIEGETWKHVIYPSPISIDSESRKIGEANGASKLNANLVREIRSAVASGEMQKTVAKRLGVGTATINRVVKRQLWTHVS